MKSGEVVMLGLELLDKKIIEQMPGETTTMFLGRVRQAARKLIRLFGFKEAMDVARKAVKIDFHDFCDGRKRRWTSKRTIATVNAVGKELLEKTGEWIEFEKKTDSTWTAYLLDDADIGPKSEEDYAGPNAHISNYRGD